MKFILTGGGIAVLITTVVLIAVHVRKICHTDGLCSSTAID